MNDFEILGWIGFAFISLGYYLNSQKKINCFYFWALGNIIFIVYAYQIESYPMLFMSLVTLAMNVYGYIQWK
tara:strand:- start:687 stop:902 length:216 start_codon:yes stop_codon:yes gene_type:complete